VGFTFRKKGVVARRGLVTGRVQSVAFRFYTRQEATQLGLAGWVRNLADGRVAFHVQGAVPEIEEFLAWIRRGPPQAVVSDLELTECEPEPLGEFEIR
jgi:acylphosphatase